MDDEIKNLFREKNRNILITNLKYDLSKNIDSLLNTITNIYNLEFDTAIKNIIAILTDSNIINGDKFVINSINTMKLDNYSELEKLILNKKTILEKNIDTLEFEQEELEKYYDVVFTTTKDIKNNFNAIIDIEKELKNLNNFILDNGLDENNDLALSRVSDYLKNRLYGKLETKIHMELMLRDNNLINKAKESFLRFQEITLKTLKN